MGKLFVSFVSLLALAGLGASVSQASTENYLTGASRPTAVLTQPDGRILVGVADGRTAVVARFTADGKADTSFDGGIVKVGGPTGEKAELSLVLQDDGKVLALIPDRNTGEGYRSGSLIRLDSDGSLDDGFGERGVARVPLSEAITVQPDGKILLAGSNVTCDRYTRCPGPNQIVRLLPNGAIDPTFGEAGFLTFELSAFPYGDNSRFADLDLDGDGNVYAAAVPAIGGSGRVVKLQPDGTPFPGFGTDGVAELEHGNGLLTIGDGHMTTIAPSTSYDDFSVARYDLDGTVDNSFGTSGLAPINHAGFRIQSGQITGSSVAPLVPASGAVTFVSTAVFDCTPDFSCERGTFLSRLTSTGDLDPYWGTNGAIADNRGVGGGTVVADIQDSGKLVVATSAGIGGKRELARTALIRYDVDGRPDSTFGEDGIHLFPAELPSCYGRPADFAVTEGRPTRGYKQRNSMTGSAAADDLSGRDLGDFICGKDGRDVLSGKAGNDRISGGPGADTISGGIGRDRIEGGAGNDRINVRDGIRDLVLCGRGRDVVTIDRQDRTKNCERFRFRVPN